MHDGTRALFRYEAFFTVLEHLKLKFSISIYLHIFVYVKVLYVICDCILLLTVSKAELHSQFPHLDKLQDIGFLI